MEFDYDDLPDPSDIGFTKKVLFVDLETTGLQRSIPDACTVSIGAVLMDVDGSVESTFYRVICPTEEQLSKASPKAFEVNGFTPEKLREEGHPATIVWSAFSEWAKMCKLTSTNHYYVGQNPGFDLAFIAAENLPMINKYGWVYNRVIDVIDLYSVAQSKFIVPFISDTRKGKNGNGLAKALGVPGEPMVHNALEGAKLNMRNYVRLAQLTRRWQQAQS